MTDFKITHDTAFWEKHSLTRFGEQPALSTAEGVLSYSALAEHVAQKKENILQSAENNRPLILLKLTRSPESIINYLACLQSKAVACLLPDTLSDALLDAYIQKFQPNCLLFEDRISMQHRNPIAMDDTLAVLLTTSGSTGASKCVGLSYNNLSANTQSIIDFLPIRQEDTTLTTLPLSYSYGLSVLNTHLAVGAQIFCSALTVFEKRFWEIIKNTPITSLAGVPSFYKMLLKLRLTRMDLPHLRYFTQAGGRLPSADVLTLTHYANAHGKQFFVMYGQTEATARMGYLTPDQALKTPQAIGQAIPGGTFRLGSVEAPAPATDINAAPNNTDTPKTDDFGELEYAGPNVMLGYVNNQAGLTDFEKPHWLKTGDLAQRDAAGIYRVVGRLKRMIKINGERLSLDSLEHSLTRTPYTVYCLGKDDALDVFCDPTEQNRVRHALLTKTQIPERHFTIHTRENWPLLENGKIDYTALKQGT